ncbi:acid protease [Hypoxylon fragiforme]|uniref:acid protease n=1 Tax=Hypoxylon fragiforme TaxID=63214 RepID=UPI0020C6ED38|nr:acid protease [Hypoxylon fragiforme]KAI2605960.1 acid protease [Hypoxylon fragiforme]
MSCDDIEPFQLPIKDVQVLPEIPNSLMRGIAATVGTPPQNIVLLPWPDLNNTWIYDEQAYCDSTIIWNGTICQVRRGNYYLEVDSSTWVKADDIVAAGGAPTETQARGSEQGVGNLIYSSLGGTDDFGFDSSNRINGMPIGIPRSGWDHGYTILHAMGMGTNSTILNALFQTGQIGSRVWSIFWGHMWVDDGAVDGSIVFGGYDQQKVIGKNYTQPLDFSDNTGCWTGMMVHISKVTLNIRTGENINILPANTEIHACIVPQRQLLLEAPESMIATFENATNTRNIGLSYGLHWSAYLYDASDYFDGDLTISLSTGLDVRIPNSQYMVPFVDIDRNGSRFFNTSERELLIGGLADQPATLGRYFLTSAYLMIDQDSDTFTLWQANPTSDSKLVSVVTNENAECGNRTSTPDSNASSPDTSQNSQAATGLSGGSIAGVVVGVVVGLGILGLGILFYLRRARRQAEFTQAATDSPTPINESRQANRISELPPTDPTKSWYNPVHELHGSIGVPSEVSGQDHYIYEMDGDINTRRV